MSKPSKTYVLSICVVLILIIAARSFFLYIKEEASASERPVIMVKLISLERFLNYPCEPGTEDYKYEGYLLCERRHSYVPRKKTVWPSPFPRLRTDI